MKRFFFQLLGIIIYVLLLHFANFSWSEIIIQFKGNGIWGLLIVFVFTIIFYLLASQKWKLIVNSCLQKNRLGFVDAFRYISISYMLSLLIPQGISETICKTAFLNKKHSIPIIIGVYSVILDHFFNIFINIILLVPSCLFMTKILNPSTAISVCIIICIIACSTSRFYGEKFIKALSWGHYILTKVGSYIPYLKSKIEAVKVKYQIEEILPSQGLFTILVLSCLRNFILSFRLYFMALVMGLDISFAAIFFSGLFIILTGLIPLIPGGLGIVEVGWFAGLKLAGVNDLDIISFTIGSRIFSNLSMIIIGILSIIIPGSDIHFKDLSPQKIRINA